jgi:hypothetical protein
MLNKQRLQAVKDRMLANRDHFQYQWVFTFLLAGFKQTPNNVGWGQNQEIPKFIKDCGTHCCVAGFTMQEALSDPDCDYLHADTVTAADYLGLTQDELRFLFTPKYGESDHLVTDNDDVSYLLSYPNLDGYNYRSVAPSDGFDEAIRRIDYLLAKPE